MEKREWFVVLRTDGTVEATQGGAPSTWVGRPIGVIPDVPPALREAAEQLVAEHGPLFVRRRRISLGREHIDVELLVCEAVPVRRAFTRVNDLLMRTLDVFAAQAHANDVILETDHAPTVPDSVLIDGEKIAWVLSTLVGNALRYLATDGKESRIAVRLAWDEGLVITVEDNGPGIPSDRVRFLFETDPKSGRAAGLSLVMVRGRDRRAPGNDLGGEPDR